MRAAKREAGKLRAYFESLDLDGSGKVDLNEYDKYRVQDAMAHRERSKVSSYSK